MNTVFLLMAQFGSVTLTMAQVRELLGGLAVQTIHEVAQFTLHDSWATLKRYANLRAQDVPER